MIVPVISVALVFLALLYFWKQRKQKNQYKEEIYNNYRDSTFNPNGDPESPVSDVSGTDSATVVAAGAGAGFGTAAAAVISKNGTTTNEEPEYRGWEKTQSQTRSQSITDEKAAMVSRVFSSHRRIASSPPDCETYAELPQSYQHLAEQPSPQQLSKVLSPSLTYSPSSLTTEGIAVTTEGPDTISSPANVASNEQTEQVEPRRRYSVGSKFQQISRRGADHSTRRLSTNF